MANTKQDCAYIPLPEYFTYFYQLHTLGCNRVGNAFTPAINSHTVYAPFTLNVDSRYLVSRIDDIVPGQKYWTNGYASNGYPDTSEYVPLSNTEAYGETGIYKQFYKIIETDYAYTYPEDQYTIGVIKNLTSTQYEICIIAEESEKSYYTLETRLFTYPLRWEALSATPPETSLVCANHDDYSWKDPFLPAFSGEPFDYSNMEDYISDDWLQAELGYDESYRDPYGVTMAFFLQGVDPNKPSEYYYENEACAIYNPNGAVYSASTGANTLSRYLIPPTTYWSSPLHNQPIRYVGSLLSDCNAYASSLAFEVPIGPSQFGKTVQIPEHGICGYTLANYTCPSDYAKYPRSKQCQLTHTPKKLGVDNIQGPQDSHPTVHWDYINCTEGYLTDRDVILASVNGATSGRSGLFNHNNDNIKELEFEMFYCANVNDPTAVLNLVTFAKKYCTLVQGYNTKIYAVNNTLGHGSNPNARTTIQNDGTYYNNIDVIYKSSVSFDSVNQNDSLPSVSQFNGSNNSNISVVPSAIFKNMHIWNSLTSNKVESIYTITGSILSSYNFTYGTYIIGLYDRQLYVIHKSVYDAYFYNPKDFTALAREVCTTGDPFAYTDDYNAYHRHGVTSTATLNTIAGLDFE